MKKKDYQETSLWYKEEITDPYQIIAVFFSADNVSNYRRYIKDILHAAYSFHIWKKGSPTDLFYHFEKLESLINATYLINKEGKDSPLTIRKQDMLNPNLYCGWHSNYTEWDYFPRVLSQKEFVNPYLVFRRFFKYLNLIEWKNELHMLLHYALCKKSIFEDNKFVDCFLTHQYLIKLIEAAHLIDVREINHIDGIIKNRYKKMI